MKDYSLEIELPVDANPNIRHPLMNKEWQRELRRLAGERLIQDLEKNTTPFTVETAYKCRRTDTPNEMKLVLIVEVKFKGAQ